MKHVFKTIINIISYIIIAFLLMVLFVSLLSQENLPINYKSLLVQSGSMLPTIDVGDIIVISKMPNYKKYDVITFTDKEKRTVTHRIMDIIEEKNTKEFITKGDANRSIDNNNITKDQIQGKVVFTLPKFGYFVRFAKTPIGLILLLIVPLTITLYDEIRSFWSKKR